MQAIIEWNKKSYKVQLDQPIDISIPMQSGENNPNAFHIPHPLFEPVRVGDFVGSVKNGTGANCENLHINAHGNGTHTECVGHITEERITINQCLTQFFFIAQLVSVEPNKQSNGDFLVLKNDFPDQLLSGVNAVIMRTTPNATFKLSQVYSGNNPVYLDPALTAFLAQQNILHLLVDLPSVDREEDEGAMLAHKAFWGYPADLRTNATISEMVFVPDAVADGIYLLNLQIASLETDASPSKPVLYILEPA
ncbi:MAG: cyclase family protein [Bacteroidia bacterium]|nr:cyclase family protein [Bacteroidia bacterium]